MNKLKKLHNKYLSSNEQTKKVNFFLTEEKRIPIDKVPTGYYRYRIRYSDTSTSVPVSLEKNVLVNHYHDVLADQKIPYLEESNQNYIGMNKAMVDT